MNKQEALDKLKKPARNLIFFEHRQLVYPLLNLETGKADAFYINTTATVDPVNMEVINISCEALVNWGRSQIVLGSGTYQECVALLEKHIEENY